MLSLLVIILLFPVLQIQPLRFVNHSPFIFFWGGVAGGLFVIFGCYILLIWLFFIILMIRQTWNSLSDGACTRTLRQHSDYVTCLAAAEKNVISFSIFSWILNA